MWVRRSSSAHNATETELNKKSVMDMWDGVGTDLDTDDEPDYPGSTLPRNRPGGSKYKQRQEAKAGERTYQLSLPDGTLQTFYTISTVARIFGRKPVTIRAWETKGLLPVPSYRTPKPRGNHLGEVPRGKRLYTQTQIDYLVALCERYKMLDFTRADWTGFQKAMAEYPTK